MRYLLDTNIVSDLLRNPSGKVAARVLRHGIERVCTSIIVAAEMRYGIARIRSRALAVLLDRHFEYLRVIPFESPADVVYGVVRAELERGGSVIGPNDLLIAAHAMVLDC